MDDEDPRIRTLEGMGEAATRPAAIFEAIVRLRWPEIAWRRPIDIKAGGRIALGCRLCIAQHGFRADTGKLYASLVDFAQHLTDEHPLD